MMLPSIFGENLFDDWMDFSFPSIDKALYGNHSQNVMKTDVKETENGYELAIDLPGFKKDDVNAQLENGYLKIEAVKNVNNDEKDENGKYIRRERYAGTMSRSFYVGDGVSQEEIHGRFEDGILKLSIPKKDPKKVQEKKFIAIEG